MKFTFLNNFIKLLLSHKIILIVISSIILIGTSASIYFIIDNNKQNNTMYTITFDSSGGSYVEQQQIEYGKNVVMPTTPTKQGFVFLNWELNEEEFDFDSKIYNNIVITAKWKPLETTEICTVKFFISDGDLYKEIEVAKNNSILEPIPPEKDGYSFIAWYLNNTLFDFSTIISENISLYAKWENMSSDINTLDNANANITVIDNTNTVSNNKPTCSYSKQVEERIVQVGYKDHFNWTFSTGISYDPNTCHTAFETSNSSIASLSSDGYITALKIGVVYVYQTIIVNDTNEEIGRFKGKLIIQEKIEYPEYQIDNFASTYEEREITIGIKSEWPYGNPCAYNPDIYEIRYKTDNKDIIDINDKGFISANALGTTNVYFILAEKKNNIEVWRCTYRITVEERLPFYFDADNIDYSQGTIYDYEILTIENKKTYSWFFSKYSVSDPNRLITLYKSDNTDIISIDSDGTMHPKLAGKTKIYSYIIEKNTNKELWRCTVDVTVEMSYKEKEEIGIKLLNQINGYYWYLDGYQYAYLLPHSIDWHDHKLLDWDSKYIEIENGKFILSEDTGNIYYRSSEIYSHFMQNPDTSCYSLIEKYNMHVNGNKLYITLNGTTYSFTKYTSEKNVTTNFNLEKNSITLDNNSYNKLLVEVSPKFSDDHIYAYSDNNSIVQCDMNRLSNGNYEINFIPKSKGNTTVNVVNANTTQKKSINVIVNDLNTKVTGISLNNSSLSLKKGENYTLIATISPENASNKNIVWSTNNNEVATVSNTGEISTISAGTAIITATTEDGNFSASCNVEVSYPKLSVTPNIGYSIQASNTSTSQGIIVKLNTTGGNGIYTYSMKVYKDGTNIFETQNITSNECFINGYKNGSYYIEYTVKDSVGNTLSDTSPIFSIN